MHQKFKRGSQGSNIKHQQHPNPGRRCSEEITKKQVPSSHLPGILSQEQTEGEIRVSERNLCSSEKPNIRHHLKANKHLLACRSQQLQSGSRWRPASWSTSCLLASNDSQAKCGLSMDEDFHLKTPGSHLLTVTCVQYSNSLILH